MRRRLPKRTYRTLSVLQMGSSRFPVPGFTKVRSLVAQKTTEYSDERGQAAVSVELDAWSRPDRCRGHPERRATAAMVNANRGMSLEGHSRLRLAA